MPYSVIIIDDNVNTVKSLQYGLEWDKLGLEVAGVAYDGLQGASLIRENSPDIIITDINMPYLDGLSMIEALLTALPDLKVIVITGYDKFQYASRAIKLSVFDYILKPINDEELFTALGRAVNSIKKNKTVLKQRESFLKARLIAAICSNQEINDHEELPFWTSAGNSFVVVAVASQYGISQPLLQRLDGMDENSNMKKTSVMIDQKLVIFCVAKDSEINWNDSLRQLHEFLKESDASLQIGNSRICTVPETIKSAYLQAYEIMLKNAASNHAAGPARDTQWARVADMQMEAVKLADGVLGSIAYNNTYQTFLEYTGGSLISLQLMTIIYCARILQKHKQWTNLLEPIVYTVTDNTSIERFGTWLLAFLKEVDLAKSYESGKSELVAKALNYMEHYVLDNIRLEDVGGALYVSPNYLSSLISKETGITFQQHMITFKMEIAKQLLYDTRMRVEEISYAIGYENYVSFYNVFKRTEGINPTEFRMRGRD